MIRETCSLIECLEKNSHDYYLKYNLQEKLGLMQMEMQLLINLKMFQMEVWLFQLLNLKNLTE
jgi:hypothetical protein